MPLVTVMTGNVVWKRWQREHQSRVIHEDLISLEHVREVSQLDLLAQVLPERIGSPPVHQQPATGAFGCF
jgi:hypothetical protein